MYSKYLHIIPDSAKYQNTYNNFTVRLPELLNIDDSFEIALTEINLPHIFKNIGNRSFITIIKSTNSKNLNKNNITSVLKFEMKAGYYKNGKYLMMKIQEQARKIVNDPSKRISDLPQDYNNLKYEFFYQKQFRNKRSLDQDSIKKRYKRNDNTDSDNLNPFKPDYDPWFGTHLKDPDTLNVENIKPIITENVQNFISSKINNQNLYINEIISNVLKGIKKLFDEKKLQENDTEKSINEVWVMMSDMKRSFVKRIDDIVDKINKSVGSLIASYNITLISDLKKINEDSFDKYFKEILNSIIEIKAQITNLSEKKDFLMKVIQIEKRIKELQDKISSIFIKTDKVNNDIEKLFSKTEKIMDTQKMFDENVTSKIKNESDSLLEKFDTIFTILKSNEDVFTNELLKTKEILITKLNALLSEISQCKISQNKNFNEIFKRNESIENILMKNIQISLDDIINEIKRTRKNTNKKIVENKNKTAEEFEILKTDFLKILKEKFLNHLTALKNTEIGLDNKMNDIMSILVKFKEADETALPIWNNISSLHEEISLMIKNQNKNIETNLSNKLNDINLLINNEITESTRIKRDLVKKNIQHNIDLKAEFEYYYKNDIIKKLSEIEHKLEQTVGSKVQEMAIFYERDIKHLLDTFSTNQNEFIVKISDLFSKMNWAEETILKKILYENLDEIKTMFNHTNEKIDLIKNSFESKFEKKFNEEFFTKISNSVITKFNDVILEKIISSTNENIASKIIDEISNKFEKEFLPKIITEMGNLYVKNYDYFSNLNNRDVPSYSMTHDSKTDHKIQNFIRLKYNTFSNHFEISNTSESGYTHFKFEKGFSKILGFETDEFYVENSKEMTSLSQTNLQNTQTIFVYCDFVKDVTISDINSPLLAIIPIPDIENFALGSNINISFPVRSYIEMREKNNLQELTFWLRDSFGNKLNFDFSLSPIILTLHIRTRQKNTLII